MMQNNNVISLTRGDTLMFKFQRLDASSSPILTPPDKMYFTVKTNANNPAFVLQKTLNDMTLDQAGYYHVVVEPEDTDTMGYGTYVYDIEVVAGDYKQTISMGSFVVKKEVTFVGNEG